MFIIMTVSLSVIRILYLGPLSKKVNTAMTCIFYRIGGSYRYHEVSPFRKPCELLESAFTDCIP